jgi:hypothetical protein
LPPFHLLFSGIKVSVSRGFNNHKGLFTVHADAHIKTALPCAGLCRIQQLAAIRNGTGPLALRRRLSTALPVILHFLLYAFRRMFATK